MLRFIGEFVGGRSLPAMNFRHIFNALKYRNYRLWFIGQSVSLMGTWMQTAAQGFLVFELTHSPAYLGYVGFATGAPSCLLMFYGGVCADRISRRKLLILTQASMMILAFILAFLAYLEIVEAWHIILLAVGLGIANAFDAPARQAFVLEMVEREDLSNAIALNATLFNLGVLSGPAIAGLVYVAVGPAWCFTLNGLSFIAVITALFLMRLKPIALNNSESALFDDFKQGITYLHSQRVIRTLISIIFAICIFGAGYMTLVPAWAVNVLAGDATTNGWLLSARGVGALCAAMMIAAFGRYEFKGQLITLGTFIFPLMLIAFANVRLLPLSILFMACTGWGYIIISNVLNSLIQSLVSDEYRGRVVSLYALGVFGLTPVGSLLAGWVAEYWGAPLTINLGAVICFLYAIWVFLKVPEIRQQRI